MSCRAVKPERERHIVRDDDDEETESVGTATKTGLTKVPTQAPEPPAERSQRRQYDQSTPVPDDLKA